MIIVLILLLLPSCVSIGYHQRKMMEAKGIEPFESSEEKEKKEYENFMNHVHDFELENN